jgi:hypothetical protein
LRDEIAQSSEANRRAWRQKEDTGRSGGLGTSASKRLQKILDELLALTDCKKQ